MRLAPVLIQPMAADDVAAALRDVAVGAPTNGRVDIAGPERFRLDDLGRRFLAARDDAREVVTDPTAPYFGAVLEEDTLVPLGEATLGEHPPPGLGRPVTPMLVTVTSDTADNPSAPAAGCERPTSRTRTWPRSRTCGRALFGLAYRMLGSVAEAEDVVQDAWLRWQGTDRRAVRNPAAFLTTTTTRLAINATTSAHARRETYIGPWLPEPVDTSADPALGAERAEALETGRAAPAGEARPDGACRLRAA